MRPSKIWDSAAAGEPRTIAIPTDAADGIRLGGGDAPPITIELPFAHEASDAAQSHVPGVVVYDNNNGSSIVPVVREDGGIQINTVIAASSAPKRYDYPMSLASGQSLHLNADGSAVVADGAGTIAIYIDTPWAKDANGDDVPTHYEVEGNVLTQVVDFLTTTAFPVVADPSVITTVYTYSRNDVERMWNTYQSMGAICNLIPGMNYMAALLCPGGARVRDAVNSAHYQKKRLKATFNNCGFTYCNSYDYSVIS